MALVEDDFYFCRIDLWIINLFAEFDVNYFQFMISNLNERQIVLVTSRIS